MQKSSSLKWYADNRLKMTYAMICSFDEENEGKDEQAFRFPNRRWRGRKCPNWFVVKALLNVAHKKASKELTNCEYPKISFLQNTVTGRHMHDVGHILEFKRKNMSNESKAQDETEAVIAANFEAKYPHEISVKKGEHVQVNKTYLTHT